MMFQIKQSVTPYDEGWWKWAVWLDGPEDELDEVEWVEYILHPTFPNPVRKIKDRDTNFRLESRGWGEFNIKVHVYLDDRDDPLKLEHWLELDDISPMRWAGTESVYTNSQIPRTSQGQPLLFVSSSSADMEFTYALKDALEEVGLEVVMGQDLDYDQPLEMLLTTERRHIHASLFVVSDVRNPLMYREYQAFSKSEIFSMVVQIGDPRDLPSEMANLPKFQIKDVSETEAIAENIARRIRDQF